MSGFFWGILFVGCVFWGFDVGGVVVFFFFF